MGEMPSAIANATAVRFVKLRPTLDISQEMRGCQNSSSGGRLLDQQRRESASFGFGKYVRMRSIRSRSSTYPSSLSKRKRRMSNYSIELQWNSGDSKPIHVLRAGLAIRTNIAELFNSSYHLETSLFVVRRIILPAHKASLFHIHLSHHLRLLSQLLTPPPHAEQRPPLSNHQDQPQASNRKLDKNKSRRALLQPLLVPPEPGVDIAAQQRPVNGIARSNRI